MSRNRRIEVDVNKLVNSNFKVKLENDSLRELTVEFPGPVDTPYENGLWSVRVELPRDYPYSSPSVAFSTPIFHPNVDDQTGSVCLDVINQTWTPIFGLVNIFESFLPQLLAYPNAADPLNRRAASLFNKSEQEYNDEIKRYIAKYSPSKNVRSKNAPRTNGSTTSNGSNGYDETNGAKMNNGEKIDDSDSEMSSLDEFSDEDDE